MRFLLSGLVLSAALAGCVSAVEPVPKSGFVDVPGGPVWYEIMGGEHAAPPRVPGPYRQLIRDFLHESELVTR